LAPIGKENAGFARAILKKPWERALPRAGFEKAATRDPQTPMQLRR